MMRIVILLTVLCVPCFALCPPNTVYQAEFDGCLYESIDMQTFALAEQTCQSMGGHLISVHNAFQNTQLSNIVSSQMGELNVLLGLFHSGGWNWADGTPYTYQKWGSGQPSGGGCAILSTSGNGVWQSTDCATRYPFICNIPAVNPPTMIAPTSYSHGSCRAGWSYFAGTDACYFVGYNATYYDGEKHCQSMGTHLTSVHSLAENDFIVDLPSLTMVPTNSCSSSKAYMYQTWIGAKYNGGFEWEDGTPFNYTHWDEHRNEGAVTITVETGCADFSSWRTRAPSLTCVYVCKEQLNSK